jgi:23S rRNA pseudouridine2604 synthase
LIFLTNDGDVVNKILRAGNRHEKEYLVTVDAPLTEEALRTMSQGVPMLGTTTKKCRITQVGPSTFRIILIQGLNRQIRRMCEYVGLHVIKLERTRIMHISLGRLPLGEWRDLSAEELEVLYKAVEGSSSEKENPGNAKGRGVAKASPKTSSPGPKPAGFKPRRSGNSTNTPPGSKPRSGSQSSPKGRGGKPGRRR